MPSIKIDYIEIDQSARISAGEDCQSIQWTAVRRLCEERYPKLTQNENLSALTIPWYCLLSLREALKYIMTVNGITSLEVNPKARELLLSAIQREESYKDSANRKEKISPTDIFKKLEAVGFKRQLMPYQVRNVVKLLPLNACATFSVPGGGKTTEALAYYFLTRKKSDRLLVVAPKNAFVAWEDELPACVPDAPFLFTRLTGGSEKIQKILSNDPQAIIISYHQLPNVSNEVAAYLLRNFTYFFVDESHRMKRGLEGKHGSCLLSLSHLARRKLILSGTPMPNKLKDLIPQFNFLYPEFPVREENIIDKLRSVFVRSTKSELGLEKPKRTFYPVPMSPAQQKLYDVLQSDSARHFAGIRALDRLNMRKISRCVQYMLQAASNPILLSKSPLAGNSFLKDATAEGLPNKIKVACSLTRKWVNEGHKVLIWSSFVDTVEHLTGLLSDVGAHFIHGGVYTSDDDDALDSRESKIREFNDPDSLCNVLIANPAACSEGISLHHVCHRSIYIDRNYNAAHYLQSEDRIHRIGLPKGMSTYITILSSPGSIDESVDRRLRAKVSNMQVVLNDPDLNIEPLDISTDDDNNSLGLDSADIEDIKQMLRVNA